MILGLTGGIGCGKSTATAMIAERGFRALDSDAIVREKLLKDPEVLAAIRGRFGGAVFAPDGALDRAAIARRVFEDDEALRWLEGLLHPRVRACWQVAFAAEPGASWVVEVPLLFENSLQNWFDLTVCVASDHAVQLARLEQRGLPPQLARQRILRQLPLTQKIELADFVLLNDGSPDFLRDQVAALVHILKAN